MSRSLYLGNDLELLKTKQKTTDTEFFRGMALNQCLLSISESTMQGYLSTWQLDLSFSVDCFWFCLTGLKKTIFSGIYNRGQWNYVEIFDRYHLLVDTLVEQNGYQADAFMLYENDAKQLAVVFSPGSSPQCTPHELAQQINDLGQRIYKEQLFNGDFRFCNVTALSEQLHGYTGIREGYLQTRKLNDLSYFHMEPEVITESWLSQRRNNADYQSIIELCQDFSRSLDTGNANACQKILKTLFLDRIKHSFHWSLLQSALSHLKYLLTVRYVVWDLELPDLERICSVEAYLRIEDCMEALWNVSKPICATAENHSPRQDLTLRAIYYIKRNFANNISTSDVASYVNVTPNYLSDVFQRELGHTVRECITTQRLESAKTMLLQNLRVSDVAKAVGFYDVQYFCRIFKKDVGMTPGEYRKKFQSQESS